MTLRLRLILVLAGIMALGLVAADVATYTSLRSYLFSQVDTQLDSAVVPVTEYVICQTEPVCPRREIGAVPPAGVWVQVRDQSGTVIGESNPNFYSLPAPSLPSQLPQATGSGGGAVVFDVNGSSGATTVNYRVLVETTSVDGAPYTGVVAIPLTDVHHTLGRLLLVELLVTGAVLIVLGVLASWIVRRNLRPLDEMAATAGAIAGGDLSQRVATADERTEVGQLGNALNVMLTGIEDAFAARAASEDRLRRFLADASHELRTPLTSIRGYSELFERGARDRPEDLAISMRHIREEAARMGVLVDDLLLLARLDRQRPLQLERVDLNAVVHDAVRAAGVAAPERSVSLHTPGHLYVEGDPDRLRQVIDNLLANALLHTPETAPVEVRLRREDASVLLEVADGGPGVPAREQANIFEPFRRADPTRARATGGAGLGLTIVSAIAHAHGGTVGVVSPAPGPTGDSAGPGAIFWVRLPEARHGATEVRDWAGVAAPNGYAPGGDDPPGGDGTPAGAAPEAAASDDAADQTLAIDAKRV